MSGFDFSLKTVVVSPVNTKCRIIQTPIPVPESVSLLYILLLPLMFGEHALLDGTMKC